MSEGVSLLSLLAAIGWFWHTSRGAHERVLEISRVVCAELDVQRLDDSVALRRFRLGWIPQGPTFRRYYVFEFSRNGADRRSGEIALVGLRLDWVRIEHPDGDYFFDIPATGT